MAVLPTGRYCDYCWRNSAEFERPCVRCGRMDHLNHGGLCKSCRATDAISALFDPAVLRRQPKLTALQDHLLAADARYVLQIKKVNTVWNVFARIAALDRPVRHTDLDAMGTLRSVSQVRSLLVQLSVLEQRDEYAVAIARVAAREINALPHWADQLALRRFIAWRQQRRNSDAPLTLTQSANDRREIRIIASMIRAFNVDGTTIATARQVTLDAWAITNTAPFRVRRFLRWCARAGINTTLLPPPYQRGSFRLGGNISASNEAALGRCITGDDLPARLRLAVLLTVAYGIRVHRIAGLRRDAFLLNNGRAVVRLGSVDLHLPDAAASWVSEILTDLTIRHRVDGERQDQTWLFPGYRHDGHIVPSSLAVTLRNLGVSPAGAHQTSIAAMITQVPPAVIARLLGVSVKTAAEWHAIAASAPEHR